MDGLLISYRQDWLLQSYFLAFLNRGLKAANYCDDHHFKIQHVIISSYSCKATDVQCFCSPGGHPCILQPAVGRTEADAEEHSAPWWYAEKLPSVLSQNVPTPPQSAVELVSELSSAKKDRMLSGEVPSLTLYN